LLSEGKGIKTSHTKAITHCLPQADQWCPARLQARPTSHPSLFISEYDITWHGTRLWSVWVSCRGCVPSQLLAHRQPTRCGGRVGKTESLDTVQELLSNSQNTGLLSTLLYRGSYQEIRFI